MCLVDLRSWAQRPGPKRGPKSIRGPKDPAQKGGPSPTAGPRTRPKKGAQGKSRKIPGEIQENPGKLHPEAPISLAGVMVKYFPMKVSVKTIVKEPGQDIQVRPWCPKYISVTLYIFKTFPDSNKKLFRNACGLKIVLKRLRPKNRPGTRNRNTETNGSEPKPPIGNTNWKPEIKI